MKRPNTIIFVAAALACLVWAGNFFWRNLQGAGPAWLSPPQDIAKLLDKDQGAPGGQNLTGFPLKLPPGFSISIFARGLTTPRVLALDPEGTLLVSLLFEGRVVALPDRRRRGMASEVVTVRQDLRRPHGLAFFGGKLYIAETPEVAVYDYDPKTFQATNKRKIISLPPGGRHFTRTLLFLPPPNQGKLLISVGSECNVCVEKDWRYAKILVADAEGRGLKPFASGLRNAVFMALHPVTRQVWATEMGRDYLGDNLPPDEINIIEEGKDYGWPWCYGKQVHDRAFDPSGSHKEFCRSTAPAYIDIPAHSAPLGLAFFPKEWPEEYRYNLLVAYHGSWNRTIPTGYKVVRYRLDSQGRYPGVEDFITGWLRPGGQALGRPVDILIRPDGVMFISDDKAGVIYRVAYMK
jgi:glucose/arabinose dehydrogenase